LCMQILGSSGKSKRELAAEAAAEEAAARQEAEAAKAERKAERLAKDAVRQAEKEKQFAAAAAAREAKRNAKKAAALGGEGGGDAGGGDGGEGSEEEEGGDSIEAFAELSALLAEASIVDLSEERRATLCAQDLMVCLSLLPPASLPESSPATANRRVPPSRRLARRMRRMSCCTRSRSPPRTRR